MDEKPLITETDKNIIITATRKLEKEMLEQAMLDFNSNKNIWSANFNSSGESTDVNITPEKVDSLALGCQNDLNKIQQINNISRFYINKNDILGKVYESIESNINTNWELVFPKYTDENKEKVIEIEEVISDFLDNIGIESIIETSITSVFTEGTYIMYLRKNNPSYQVDYYPLKVVEISDWNCGGEPYIVVNIDELKSRLNKIYKKTRKNKALFYENMDEEIKSTYPKEVYEAYINKEQFAKLDVKNSGVIRINNMNRKYGLTPIFRSLKPVIRLDNVEKADDQNTSARGKKIIFQKLCKELVTNTKEITSGITWSSAQQKAHGDLIKALGAKNVSVYTGLPWTESVEYVEPKIEQTNVQTKRQYKNDILSSLGISFISSDNVSYSSAQISVKELSKTINKIARQLQDIINKWIKGVMLDNSFDLNFAPKFKITSSALLEDEIKLSLAQFLFDKMGASFETVYEIFGKDYNTEVMRRKKENEKNLDTEVFYPRANAFNSNGNELQNTGGRGSGLDGNKVKDLDKTVKDKDRHASFEGGDLTDERT